MKHYYLAIILVSLLSNGYSQSFYECFNRITKCFTGLNGYGSETGRDDIQCAGISTCDGYLTCVKGVQYAKGFVCIPVMGPFCVKTLLDVIGDAIGCYLGQIDRRFPRCEIDNSMTTAQFIACVRQDCRIKYGSGPILTQGCEAILGGVSGGQGSLGSVVSEGTTDVSNPTPRSVDIDYDEDDDDNEMETLFRLFKRLPQ